MINGVAGILCALAPSFTFLLISRVIQGIGIAGMAPMALVLIGDLYDGSERAAAMWGLSSTRSAGGIIAPLLGGTLASLSWNFSFLVYTASIPLAGILWFWFPFPEKGDSISIGEYLEPLKNAVKNSRVQAVLLFNFLSFFLVYTVVTFIPTRLADNPTVITQETFGSRYTPLLLLKSGILSSWPVLASIGLYLVVTKSLSALVGSIILLTLTTILVALNLVSSYGVTIS